MDILVLVCYMLLPGDYEECVIGPSTIDVEEYCERAHKIAALFDDIICEDEEGVQTICHIEITKCVEQ